MSGTEDTGWEEKGVSDRYARAKLNLRAVEMARTRSTPITSVAASSNARASFEVVLSGAAQVRLVSERLRNKTKRHLPTQSR